MNLNWSIIFEDFETGDILRVSKLWPNCRDAKKTQISLDLKKYRYVGDNTGFKAKYKVL